MNKEKFLTLPFIIAITALIGFLILLFVSYSKDPKSEMASTGFVTLSGILTTVVGYYFGNSAAKDTNSAVQESVTTLQNTMNATFDRGIEAGRLRSTQNPEDHA